MVFKGSRLCAYLAMTSSEILCTELVKKVCPRLRDLATA